MPETMVERVAKAIEAKVHDAASDGDICTGKDLARIALQALREPSKEMIEPGYSAMHDAVDYYNYDSGSGYTIEPSAPSDIWRAMIDAALSEGAER